jgi:hypothetical protein
MILPHLTSWPDFCRAPPHTPKRVVVGQLQCRTCRTFAAPEVGQVGQNEWITVGVENERVEEGEIWPPRGSLARRIRPPIAINR